MPERRRLPRGESRSANRTTLSERFSRSLFRTSGGASFASSTPRSTSRARARAMASSSVIVPLVVGRLEALEQRQHRAVEGDLGLIRPVARLRLGGVDGDLPEQDPLLQPGVAYRRLLAVARRLDQANFESGGVVHLRHDVGVVRQGTQDPQLLEGDLLGLDARHLPVGGKERKGARKGPGADQGSRQEHRQPGQGLAVRLSHEGRLLASEVRTRRREVYRRPIAPVRTGAIGAVGAIPGWRGGKLAQANRRAARC